MATYTVTVDEYFTQSAIAPVAAAFESAYDQEGDDAHVTDMADFGRALGMILAQLDHWLDDKRPPLISSLDYGRASWNVAIIGMQQVLPKLEKLMADKVKP